MQQIDFQIVDKRLEAEGMVDYATSGSAGIDLRACVEEAFIIKAGETKLVSAGFAIHMKDPTLAALVLPRSGLGYKHGIVTGNLVGLIDSDYQGVIHVPLWNRSSTDFTINPLDRIAQMIFVPIIKPLLQRVENFAQTSARGTSGFGSTGVL
jgi:dUTP pyrophosphatase